MAQSRTAERFDDSAGHMLDTLWALVGREFRMRYKGSFFGVLWAVLSPLGTVVILQLVFTRILAFSTSNFTVFMYSAMLPWAWFSAAIQSFSTVLKTDPRCVMAQWGIAYAAGPNYNKQWKAFDPTDLARSLKLARKATLKAQVLAKKGKPVEQALIAAGKDIDEKAVAKLLSI